MSQHTIEQVRIVKNSSEYCPEALRSVMTLYFEEGRPTPKQVLHCAKSLAHCYKTRPNFNSLHLRFFYKVVGTRTRVQIVD